MAARAEKKATPTVGLGDRNENAERIRLEVIAETIRAIRRLNNIASADLLSDIDDMRALAKKLGVPLLFIWLLDRETDGPGPIEPADISEMSRWEHRDLVKVA